MSESFKVEETIAVILCRLESLEQQIKKEKPMNDHQEEELVKTEVRIYQAISELQDILMAFYDSLSESAKNSSEYAIVQENIIVLEASLTGLRKLHTRLIKDVKLLAERRY